METLLMKTGEYTINDVINAEQHMEMVEGKVVIEDRTTVQHNTAVSEISIALKNFIAARHGNCRVFTENVALYVNELCGDDKNYFLPDVMSVCDIDGIRDDGIHTAPVFVAEITSEATKTNDYCGKLEMYRKIGVGEYWIVDLQRNIVFVYCKDNGYIPQVCLHPGTMEVRSYPGLVIDTSVFIN